MKRNLPYYVAVVLLCILLKIWFGGFATNDSLRFLLHPTNAIVGFLMGSPSVFLSEKGYFHPKINIVVDKSCSGFNFWVLCFTMLNFLLLKHCKTHFLKSAAIILTFVSTYFLTILVNSSRIFAAVVIQNAGNYFLSVKPHYMLHEIVGIATNLSFLLIIYILTEYYFIKKNHNEKPA